MLISIEKYLIKNSVRLAEQIIYFEKFFWHIGSNYTIHLINPNRPVCILCNISGQNSCQRWHFTGHCRFRELIMWWRNSPSLAKGKIKYMNQIQPTNPLSKERLSSACDIVLQKNYLSI